MDFSRLSNIKYQELLQDDSTNLESPQPSPRWKSRNARRAVLVSLSLLLSISLFLNGLFVFSHGFRQQFQHDPSKNSFHNAAVPTNPGRVPPNVNDISSYASLPRDFVEPIVRNTAYHNPDNWTASYQQWKNMDVSWGVVALSDDFVRSKGLISSQRFPWDRSKGIYLLHGMHNLHCLKMIYLAHKKFQAGEEQTIAWVHISHCFDALRRQIMCDADDTPRASFEGQEGISGLGQSRVCRNWDSYEEWAKNHTACYRRKDDPDFGIEPIERYKHCPEGSGYVVSPESL